MRAWCLQVVCPLALPLLAVAGLTGLGEHADTSLQANRPLCQSFADIELTPPPGQSRAAFLAEVQYISDLPDRLTLSNPDSFALVEAAFARHAWVEKVERITLRGHRPLQVVLRYRRPVLQVKYQDQVCALDRRGIVLPRAAHRTDLPNYRGKVQVAPATGTQCYDNRLLACAVVLGYLQETHEIETIAVDRRGVVLRLRSKTEIIWGHPPGREAADEASAPVKRERWLAATATANKGTLDLRPRPSAQP